MNKIQFLTMVGCYNCAEAKKVLDDMMPNYPNIKVEEVDMATPDEKLVFKYGIMASPGIVVNGELFSTGGLIDKKLREKLDKIKK